MPEMTLDALPLWAFFLSSCLLIWCAIAAGVQIGAWQRRRASEEKEATVGSVVGSVLGLLAFLLAFTFGIAASRFEDRRQVVLEEANAIGTAYLRTRLLPEPQRSEIARMLREYVDVRLAGAGKTRNPGDLDRVLARSEDLHQAMWSQAIAAAEKNPNVMTSLFLQSLNEVIDVHSKRVLIAIRSRIPPSIWIVLTGIAVLGMGCSGYQTGLSGARQPLVVVALVMAFSAVLTMIADLDRPWEGMLRTSQAAMADLQKGMRSTP